MDLPFWRPRGGHRRPSGPHARLQLEPLEPRSLLSGSPGSALSFSGPADPGDTLDAAAALGNLRAGSPVHVQAAIGDSPAGAADVDWYAFTLDRPETVTLSVQGGTGAPSPVLSLYVRDPFDPGDPATLLGVRRLAQAQESDPAGGTLLTRPLAAGSYYLAVSGAGNSLFNPFLAGSGYDGQAGGYQLQLAAADLGLGPGDGPAVLASDPAAGSSLDRSPLVFRLDLSAAIDPTTVLPGDDVSLTYNPAGTFGDGHDQDVPLDAFHFSVASTELQLTPAAPLAPGYYRLRLAGEAGANLDVVTGADGTPLGADALHPSGQDFMLAFRVAGVEGNTGAGARADDTPAGAHDLGDVSDGRLVQAAGAIGDDPTDPVPLDPSDVDLYHFRVTGPGRYAFAAEVFAQRIGSPLNAGVGLFVLGPNGRLRLVAGDDDTQNPTQASDHRSLPLFADPALFAGLTAGDYYLAVSSHGNVPDANLGLLPGAGGLFDPEVSHSGSAGRSRGDYVLNLRVSPEDAPPRVVAVTPGPADTLGAPPPYLTVQFDQPVNLQELAYRAYQRTQQGAIASVYVQGADGVLYYPRLQSYDPATGQATFLMLDRLPPGDYALHLSGPLGLADFAGNPLVGNDPGGDYVAHFQVGGAGTPPHTGPGANDPASLQDLGVLFPHELTGSGFTVSRVPAGGADSYRFEVLQAQAYFFLLGGAGRPAGVQLTLTDASGVAVAAKPQADGVSLQAFLKPGAYVLRVSGWDPAGGAYSLRLLLGGSSENPQPLTLGPAPVLRLTLAPAPPVVPPVVAPGGAGPAGGAPSVTALTPAGAAPAPAITPPDGPAAWPHLEAAPGPTQFEKPPAGGPPGVVPTVATAAPRDPVAGPRAGVPATAGAPGVLLTEAATLPGAPVEAPSAQLAALGAGPVGGVGTGPVGAFARAPHLSLGLPDGAAPGDTVLPTPDVGGMPSSAAPAGGEALAGSQGAAARAPLPVVGHDSVWAAVADVVRLGSFRHEWEMSFNETPLPGPGGHGSPGVPQAALIRNDEQPADAETTSAADRARSAAAAAAFLAALAGAASGLAEELRKPTAADRLRRLAGPT